LIVFVDKLSKMVILHPCQLTITGAQVAKIYYDRVFQNHGLASKFVSDRDPRFTSHFTRSLVKAVGSEQGTSSAFHPQTDGQTEIMNRYVEDTIRHYVNPAQDDWDEWLTPVQFAINNTSRPSKRHPSVPSTGTTHTPHSRWSWRL
jgi:hypothetical protein